MNLRWIILFTRSGSLLSFSGAGFGLALMCIFHSRMCKQLLHMFGEGKLGDWLQRPSIACSKKTQNSEYSKAGCHPQFPATNVPTTVHPLLSTTLRVRPASIRWLLQTTEVCIAVASDDDVIRDTDPFLCVWLSTLNFHTDTNSMFLHFSSPCMAPSTLIPIIWIQHCGALWTLSYQPLRQIKIDK